MHQEERKERGISEAKATTNPQFSGRFLHPGQWIPSKARIHDEQIQLSRVSRVKLAESD